MAGRHSKLVTILPLMVAIVTVIAETYFSLPCNLARPNDKGVD